MDAKFRAYEKGVIKAEAYLDHIGGKSPKVDPFIYDLGKRARKGNLTEEERNLLEGYAHTVLKYSAKTGDTTHAANAIRNLESLGLNPSGSAFARQAARMALKKSGKGLSRSSQAEKDLSSFLADSERPNGRLGVVLGIVGFGASLFFFSSNFTGNVVGNLTQNTSSAIGAGLFVLGLFGVSLFFNSGKRK